MATTTIRPSSGSGTNWTDVANAYDTSTTTYTTASLTRSNYSASNAVFTLNLSSVNYNNIEKATLIVRAKVTSAIMDLHVDTIGGKRLGTITPTTSEKDYTIDVTNNLINMGATPGENYSTSLSVQNGSYNSSTGQPALSDNDKAVTTAKINMRELLQQYESVTITATHKDTNINFSSMIVSTASAHGSGSIENWELDRWDIIQYAAGSPNVSGKTIYATFSSSNTTLMNSLNTYPYVCLEIRKYDTSLTIAAADVTANAKDDPAAIDSLNQINLISVLSSYSSTSLYIYDIRLEIESKLSNIKIGSSIADYIYLGTTAIVKAYLGTVLIYDRTSNSSSGGESGSLSGTTGTSNISMIHNSGVDEDGSFYSATMYARSNKVNVSEYSSITISVTVNTIFDYEIGYIALYDSSQNCVDVISVEGGTSYTTALSSNVAYMAFDMFVDDDDDPNITATMKYTYR